MFREMESIQVEMKEMEVGYMYIYIINTYGCTCIVTHAHMLAYYVHTQ